MFPLRRVQRGPPGQDCTSIAGKRWLRRLQLLALVVAGAELKTFSPTAVPVIAMVLPLAQVPRVQLFP